MVWPWSTVWCWSERKYGNVQLWWTPTRCPRAKSQEPRQTVGHALFLEQDVSCIVASLRSLEWTTDRLYKGAYTG
eukprot:jgi/Botrbrau1/15660/Bobra.4_1s0044.1